MQATKALKPPPLKAALFYYFNKKLLPMERGRQEKGGRRTLRHPSLSVLVRKLVGPAKCCACLFHWPHCAQKQKESKRQGSPGWEGQGVLGEQPSEKEWQAACLVVGHTQKAEEITRARTSGSLPCVPPNRTTSCLQNWWGQVVPSYCINKDNWTWFLRN